MRGENYIQECTMLRGIGEYEQAISCIEKHIEEISPDLRSTAWNEARFAAEELGDNKREKSFGDNANALSKPFQYKRNIVLAPLAAR